MAEGYLNANSALGQNMPEPELVKLRRRQRNAVRQIEKLEATLLEVPRKLAAHRPERSAIVDRLEDWQIGLRR